MPPVVAAASYAANALASVFVAAGVSSAIAIPLSQFLIYTGFSYGLSRLTARKPNLGSLTSSPSPLDLRIDPLVARRVIYGETSVGPVLRFRHVAGANNKYLYLILCWAGHECEAITAFKADGITLAFDQNGICTTGAFAGKIVCSHHLGRHDQSADAIFVQYLDPLWTTAHRLRSVCYSAARLEVDEKAFPTGIPQFTATIKGRKVYDWRDVNQNPADPETWLWSDNAALCNADFIRGVPMLNAAAALIRPYGIGAPETALPSARWTACANDCDEAVPLAAGGTEKRYTCNGCFDADASPPSVLDALAGAMAGKIVPVGAEFHPYAGVWHAPDFAVDTTMLRGEISASNPLPRRERINIIKGTFINPAANHARDDFPAVVSNTFITEDGGELVKDLDLAFTNSASRSQRIAKIALLRSRQGIVTQWPCNLRAIPALTGENVNATASEFGWSAKAFELAEFALKLERGNDGGLGFAVDLSMQETASTIYDWSTSEEEAKDPAPNTDLLDPRTVAAPTDLTLLSTGQGILQPDGTYVPRLKAAWTLPAEAAVQSGGRTQLQYKLHSASDWTDWAFLPGIQSFDFITDVKIGDVVDVRVRSLNNLGAPSTWLEVDSHTIAGDTGVPGTPTGLAAATGTGKAVSLTWNPNSEYDFAEYIVRRSLTSNYADSVVVAHVAANRFVDVDVSIGTPYWYWVAASDRSENTSDFTAAVTATPGTVTAGAVDTAAPADPSAPTIASSGAYNSGDGTVLSYHIVNVPAMPSGAVILNVLYRKNGSAGWIVGDQRTAGGGTSRIDDLTPGVAYDIGLQAFSVFGYGSAIVTLLNQTAPNKTTATAPTGLAVYADGGIPPRYITVGSYTEVMVNCRVKWDRITDKDHSHYQWQEVTPSDVEVASGYTPEAFVDLYQIAGFGVGNKVRVRAYNFTGVASDWTAYVTLDWTGPRPGNSSAKNVGTAAGTVAAGDDSRITGAAQKSSNLSDLANAATARSNLGVRSATGTAALTGGAATEDITYTHNFGTTQTKVLCQITGVDSGDPADYLAMCPYDDPGNDSNNTVIRVYRRDGGTLGARTVRWTVLFIL